MRAWNKACLFRGQECGRTGSAPGLQPFPEQRGTAEPHPQRESMNQAREGHPPLSHRRLQLPFYFSAPSWRLKLSAPLILGLGAFWLLDRGGHSAEGERCKRTEHGAEESCGLMTFPNLKAKVTWAGSGGRERRL